jgi:hypothetical protein
MLLFRSTKGQSAWLCLGKTVVHATRNSLKHNNLLVSIRTEVFLNSLFKKLLKETGIGQAKSKNKIV